MAGLPETEGIWDLHGCSHGDVVEGINSNQETINMSSGIKGVLFTNIHCIFMFW